MYSNCSIGLRLIFFFFGIGADCLGFEPRLPDDAFRVVRLSLARSSLSPDRDRPLSVCDEKEIIVGGTCNGVTGRLELSLSDVPVDMESRVGDRGGGDGEGDGEGDGMCSRILIGFFRERAGLAARERPALLLGRFGLNRAAALTTGVGRRGFGRTKVCVRGLLNPTVGRVGVGATTSHKSQTRISCCLSRRTVFLLFEYTSHRLRNFTKKSRFQFVRSKLGGI